MASYRSGTLILRTATPLKLSQILSPHPSAVVFSTRASANQVSAPVFGFREILKDTCGIIWQILVGSFRIFFFFWLVQIKGSSLGSGS